VTRAGAIRPTTRQPILLHNPAVVAGPGGRSIGAGRHRDPRRPRRRLHLG
jgi:hypothetical protein